MASPPHAPERDVASMLAQLPRPRRAVVTAGMPYANGPLHFGHLAGAHVPADIHARWLGLLIGRQNVLFVAAPTTTARRAKWPRSPPDVRFASSSTTCTRSSSARSAATKIGLDIYGGTSRPDCFPTHVENAHWFLRRLRDHGLLRKRTSKQWFDPQLERFLPDRLVRGRCPEYPSATMTTRSPTSAITAANSICPPS